MRPGGWRSWAPTNWDGGRSWNRWRRGWESPAGLLWTGSLEGTLKWGAFSSSEVFVLPSHQENFGIVVAEALACGLPVIVSDKVNIWREVVGGGAGFVGADTVEGTKSSLLGWAALSAEEIAALRIRARKCFHHKFDYHLTSKRAMENVECLARATTRYQPIEKIELPVVA